ncbi:MAG TPA: TolC family protein, partial [Anaeromyxobacteraceae bacterium]|nr:TolC family protein [Anaeromyxobacteraceae bacterium]
MPSPARAAALARLALLLALAPRVAGAAPLGLADFEAGLERRGEWRLAQSAVTVAEAVAQREQGNAGLRATTSAGAGGFSEPQFPAGARDYGSLSLGVGLRWPILGSASEEELRVASARLDAVVAGARRDAERGALLRGLRESFFGYAHARQVHDLARAFLADAPRVRDVLRRRQAAGIVLEADRRRAEGAFALAERELGAADAALRARGDELRRWRPDFDGEL